MGLLPLEFTDCLSDSPYFRENLHAHEKELDRTSQAIKGLVKEVKDLLSAAKALSRAQRSVANILINFKFECIGNSQTDDEIVIAGSLKEFGRLLSMIEDERDRMLDRSYETFIEPIDNFRKEHIGGAKEGKKKFDKETAKFCQSLERHLNLSTKKSENQLQEADATLEMEQRNFCKSSLEYVFLLQEVQERKKFEFVETILSFMYGWLTFYHQGHEVAKEFKTFMTDLQIRLQRTRENFRATRHETEQLMNKMLEKSQDPGSLNKMYTRQGYLFLLEKKALGSTWTKHFCQYQKDNRKFTMIPYSQTAGKITTTETLVLKECTRRMSDTIDKRFCFDITAVEKSAVYTFQALSEEDRKLWVDAMDGKEPNYAQPGKAARQEECLLDETGFGFVRRCIEVVEARGLQDQGLYRLVGVNSKVAKLTQIALDKKRSERVNLDDPDEWEIKTITSALKNYFRNLPEPLMTFRLHNAFIMSAKQENKAQRINDIHMLVHQLPRPNFEMLELLVNHIGRVAKHADKNLMTVSNLGVCFGPTLLRPEEETVAAIMDIKFGNIVVEILIENCNQIFQSKPQQDGGSEIIRRELSHPMPRPLMPQNHHLSPLHQECHVPVRRGSKDVAYTTDAGRPPGTNTAAQHPGLRMAIVPPNYVDDTTVPAPPSQVQQRSMIAHPAFVQNAGTSLVPLPGNSVPQQNQTPTSQRSRGKQPLMIYNPQWLDSHQSPSSSSSTESLNSRVPATVAQPNQISAPHLSPKTSKPSPPQRKNRTVEDGQNQCFSPSRRDVGRNAGIWRGDELRNYGRVVCNMQDEVTMGSTNQYFPGGNIRQDAVFKPSPTSSAVSSSSGRTVRTLYSCIGENESELSFEPNQIIFNVNPSREPGWLEGYLNGRFGLIPENYVEYLS